MTTRRILAAVCIVAALSAVGCAVAFTATIVHEMNVVNAANYGLRATLSMRR